MMTLKERLFHAVLFECGAIAIATLAVSLFSQNATSAALIVSILMAVTAMVWNLIFNYGFDKIFTAPREERGLGLRIFHTLSFEAGLLIFTIPMIAYFLNLGLWEAFLADVGLTVLITLYALIFNWAYDHLRLKFVAQPAAA